MLCFADAAAGDYDLTERRNVRSGLGDDEGMPEYATGDIYVRLRRDALRAPDCLLQDP